MNGWHHQRSRAIAGCSVLALALASFVRPASAQTRGGRWEVEFHAGGMLVGNPTDGSSVTLPGSEPFNTGTGAIGSPSFPSRRVSSCQFFVLTATRPTTRIQFT